MVRSDGTTFRNNVWDKPVEPKPVYKRRFTLHGSAPLEFPAPKKLHDVKAREKAKHNWNIVRKAFNAARFWKRVALATANESAVDLGSLKQFVDKRKINFKDVIWTAEQEKQEQLKKIEKESQRRRGYPDEAILITRPHTVPATKYGGPRRGVVRVGDPLAQKRSESPRHQQLKKMLPGDGEEDVWHLAWARTQGFLPGVEGRQGAWKVRTAGQEFRFGQHVPSLRPITAPEPKSKRHAVLGRGGKTSFTVAMFSGTAAKPRAEVHPLLTAIEGVTGDEVFQNATLESGLLSQRLDELRWTELRKGAWTRRPDQSIKEKDVSPVKQQERRQGGGALEAPGRQVVSAAIQKSAVKAGIQDIHGDEEQMDRLIRIMDPDRNGFVAPEVFVPLFFWLGLTRRRAAALVTLELAFGPGDIDVSHILNLSRYSEVQIRLIEGLRQLARRESLEQLCEYITDMMRVRTWFQTMKRDTTGRADIVEVQNLFARLEVTTDRQLLFRFLTHVIHSEVLPSASHEKPELQGAVAQRTFGINDFASFLCRCTVAWCFQRALMLIDPSEGIFKGDSDGPLMAPAADLDREAEKRWVSLQRKIIISLLVNHRFWGRESRTVLMYLNQPQMTTLGHQLSPEQWLSLFQRVRAQGIASTLPVGDEASDPEWLMKKALDTSIHRARTRHGVEDCGVVEEAQEDDPVMRKTH